MKRICPLPPYLQHINPEEVSLQYSFRTFSINLATALIAANVLHFAYMEVVRGQVAYTFADPLRVGPEKAKAFHEKSEAFPLVHPAFYSELRSLFVKEAGRLLNDQSH
jgi:hypothetical protein